VRYFCEPLVSPRTRVLVIYSKSEHTNHSWEVLSGPPWITTFFSRLLKRGTTLVLLAYAMYAMLYLLLPLGVLLHVAFRCLYYILYLCGTFSEAGCSWLHARLATSTNSGSTLE
jgi:hypothetical protein